MLGFGKGRTRQQFKKTRRESPKTVYEQPVSCNVEMKVNHKGKVTPEGTSTRENTIAQRGGELRDMQRVAQF